MNRRKFFRQSLFASSGLVLAPLYISCSNDDDFEVELPVEELPIIDIKDFKNQGFNYGVASFDPTDSNVIIWTRYEKTTLLSWQIAKDKEFVSIVDEGKLRPQAKFDYTIAIDIQDLPANSKFYYRFFNEEEKEKSVVGETITLPSNSNVVSKMSFAVASCANYMSGLFNVYDAMANSDIDIIIHLGDYIYEYEEGGFGTNADTVRLDRVHEPRTEILNLEDYRTRYKQYRSDVSLQLAHQKKPFICVWDDHEITNDAFNNGAENHTEETEGNFEIRKQTAIQVYSEYIPIRSEFNDPSLIYRSFDFGNLLSLHMLDTRIVGRDKQLSITDFFTSTGIDTASFQTALLDPSRKMLGDTQLSWISNKLKNSDAKWQILGQQVLMARMFMPVELLSAFNVIATEIATKGEASPSTLAFFSKTLVDLTTIKEGILRNDPTLNSTEKARVETVIPYNLDAWDGYAVEREKLFSAFANKNVINLAGDTHNAWFSDIKNATGEKVATELATASISSSGFESFLPIEAIEGFEQAITVLINDLHYFNASERGYLEVEITMAEVTAKWNFVDTLATSNYLLTNLRTEIIS